VKRSIWVIRTLLLVALIILPACQKAQAKFEISSLSIIPTEAIAGDTVSISAQVKNIGSSEGIYQAVLTVNGIKQQAKSIKIAPKGAESVSFAIVESNPGIYNVWVNDLSGELRVLEFTVSNLTISPNLSKIGQPVTATADISNSGEIEGSYTPVLQLNQQEIAGEELTIAPGTSKTAKFTFTPPSIGSYIVKVGRSSSLLVVTQTGNALTELSSAYPDLYQELLKLPDLKEMDDKNVKAINSIACLALSPEYKPAFEAMLNEGIKDKRKYCTPLEALLWIAYDGEFNDDNPLEDYSLTALINEAWKNTSTSDNYKSERWQNFDDVVDRLNSPTIVAQFVVYNVAYDTEEAKRMNETNVARWASPKETFKSKKGVCNEQARFSLYCLLQNGYYYDSFELHKDRSASCLGTSTLREWGHVTCLYTDNGLFYVIDTTLAMGKLISGPFSSIEQAADAMMPNWAVYEIADVDYHVKNRVQRPW
jgi:hypothetical protein